MEEENIIESKEINNNMQRAKSYSMIPQIKEINKNENIVSVKLKSKKEKINDIFKNSWLFPITNNNLHMHNSNEVIYSENNNLSNYLIFFYLLTLKNFLILKICLLRN